MYQQTRIPQLFTVFGNVVFDGAVAPVGPNRRDVCGDAEQAADHRRRDESSLTAVARRLAA